MPERMTTVALLRTDAFSAPLWFGGDGDPLESYREYLATAERETWSSLRNSTRKSQWLVARLAAKWLVLQSVECDPQAAR